MIANKKQISIKINVPYKPYTFVLNSKKFFNQKLNMSSSELLNAYYGKVNGFVDSYIGPVFSGFVKAGNGFVDMVSDKMTILTSMYNSNVNQSSLGSNIDGKGVPLLMPSSQFEFVEGLRREDNESYKALVMIASSIYEKNMSDDEKQAKLENFFASFRHLHN